MDSREEILVAALDVDEHTLSTVRYQALNCDQPMAIDGVQCFQSVPNTVAKLEGDEFYSGCAKAGLKGRKSIDKILEFISGGSPRQSIMRSGASALVDRSEVETKSSGKISHADGKAMVNYSQYSETVCPVAGGEENIQFFNPRSSNLKAKDKITEFDSVHIVSGICLFSQQHLGYEYGESASSSSGSGSGSSTGLSEDGSAEQLDSGTRIPLPRDLRPTMYELESIIRLSSSIGNIVSQLPLTLCVTITLDIPRVQYYAFILELFEEGGCSREHLKSWLAIIDERHEQLAAVFSKAVKNALTRRGSDRPNITITVSSGLGEVIPLVEEHVERNCTPSVTMLLDELLVRDPLWADYYACLPESQRPPKDIVSLCRASYSYQILKPVINRYREYEMNGTKPIGRQLLLNIDNPAEWRIYSEGEKFLKTYRSRTKAGIVNPLLLGMFSLERVFTGSETGRTSLYLHNCGQQLFDPSTGNLVAPADILTRVYGQEITTRVLGWAKEAGMYSHVPDRVLTNNDSQESLSSTTGFTSSCEIGTPDTEWNSRQDSPTTGGDKDSEWKDSDLKRRLKELEV